MSIFSTTKVSSKGQVVIPEDIRKAINLEAGTSLLVIGEDDVVILKKIKPPKMKDFNRLIAMAQKEAEKAGLTEDDVQAIIKQVRKK